ncbi:unnamed protein product [Rangifer tarandus platyrhynchus]|uniref:Uncharacterized protein n=1 Tax=Rangifer tarandus platyrhynchus TaxID=3082113 RepID=A0AC59YWP6_RANTA
MKAEYSAQPATAGSDLVADGAGWAERGHWSSQRGHCEPGLQPTPARVIRRSSGKWEGPVVPGCYLVRQPVALLKSRTQVRFQRLTVCNVRAQRLRAAGASSCILSEVSHPANCQMLRKTKCLRGEAHTVKG